MASQTLTQLHQSASTTPALPGTWKLGAGRAITLQPREAGTVRIAHGRVWATYDGPHHGALNELGDHVVGAGGQLRVTAGQRLVIESWAEESPAYFSWEPLPQAAAVRTARWAQLAGPWADLRLAAGLAAGALAKLAVGLVRATVLSGPQVDAGRGQARQADLCLVGPAHR
ncbi:MAG: DUF2917 domain-containing protein [Burkholderiales bacterium]|nr:DUF2917 domain-containing protein [Burkholderiales bacterium]